LGEIVGLMRTKFKHTLVALKQVRSMFGPTLDLSSFRSIPSKGQKESGCEAPDCPPVLSTENQCKLTQMIIPIAAATVGIS